MEHQNHPLAARCERLHPVRGATAYTKSLLDRGNRIVELFKQIQYNPLATEVQAAVLFAMQQGYLDSVPVDRVKEFQTKLVDFLTTRKEATLNLLRDEGKIDGAVEKALRADLDEFKTTWH